MDLIGNENLKQALEDIQIYPEYKKVLSVLLKHEIHMLLEKLSETGEESVVMTASVSDGSMTVIGSNYGEKFVLEPGHATNLVAGFKEQFALYCSASAAAIVPKHTRRSSFQECNSTETFYPTHYEENEEMEPPMTPTKGRPRKSQKDSNYHSPVYIHDESEKAIDETVSMLVKNILKESEVRERESGGTGRGRRRRRRQRCSGDPYPVHRQNYPRQREKKIAQFFPTISQSKRGGRNKGSTNTITKVEVKIEPDDCYYPEIYSQDTNNQRQNHPYKKDNVENSVDKSIQKIIEMETKSKHSDSDSNSFFEEIIEKEPVDTIDGDEVDQHEDEYMEEEELTETTTEEYENNKENMKKTSDDNITEETNDIEEVGEEGTSKLEVVIERDDINYPYEEGLPACKHDKTDQMNKSFEESSAEDLSDDTNSPPNKRKKLSRSFIHNGYSYIRDKAGKGNTVYWKCGRSGCKGRVIQRGGEKIRTQYHNHNPMLEFENDKPN